MLQLRLCKRNSGTLHTGLPKLQSAEEGVKEDNGCKLVPFFVENNFLSYGNYLGYVGWHTIADT
jgi:hypothetical protein